MFANVGNVIDGPALISCVGKKKSPADLDPRRDRPVELLRTLNAKLHLVNPFETVLVSQER